MEAGYVPDTHTLNPTCTGTSVLALSYNGGIVVVSDRVVSYGKMARFKGVCRQYQVTPHCVVSFGGDHSDFQWLQNVIERRQEELRCCNRSLTLTPKMLHAYLTTFLYYRRTRMDPLWNTLIITGLQPNDAKLEPYIGIVTQRGVSYPAKSVATGLAAMLLNQAIETDYRANEGKLTRDEAIAILRKCMEITLYKDCCADTEYDLTVIDEHDGITSHKPEKVVGNWEIAEYSNQYQ